MIRHGKSLIALPSLPQIRQVERILSTRTSLKQDQSGVYGSNVSFDGSTINETDMSVVIPFADGNNRDGVGDVVEVLGIRTDRHRKNPIALFDHGKNVSLPIGLCEDRNGRYTVERDGDTRKAWGTVYFYQGACGLQGQETDFSDEDRSQVPQCQKDEHALFCEQLFHLLAVKVVRAGSFGYLVLDARPIQEDPRTGKPKGLHLLATELLELGPVVLPANGDAVRKTLSDGKACGKALSQMLVKSLTPYASARPVMLGYTKQKDVLPQNRMNVPPAEWKPGAGAKQNVGTKRPQPSAKDCGCDDCKSGHDCPCGSKVMAKKDMTDDVARESANTQTKPYGTATEQDYLKPRKNIKDIRLKYGKGKKKSCKKIKGKKSIKSGDSKMKTGSKAMVRRVKAAPMDMPADDSMPGMGGDMDMPGDAPAAENPDMMGDEKLGAQALRRVYQDLEDIMADYDQIRSLLEEATVDKFLESHLTDAEKALSEVESIFAKLYPDYPPLGPGEGEEEMVDDAPVEDVEDVDAEIDPDADPAAEVDDALEGIDLEEEVEDEGEVELGEAEVKDDEEEEEDEEVLAEDVTAGMQTKSHKDLVKHSKKILRSKYGKKSQTGPPNGPAGDPDRRKPPKGSKTIEEDDEEKSLEGEAVKDIDEKKDKLDLAEIAKFLKEISLDPGLTDEARQKAGGWMKAVDEELGTNSEEEEEEPKAEATEDTLPEEGEKNLAPEEEIYLAGIQAKALEQEHDIEELKSQLARLAKVLP